MNILKKLPLPIAGVALSMAALGNLIKDIAPAVRPVLGAISAIILLLLIAKICTCTKGVKEALENPVIASSFATFPMAFAILTTYVSGAFAKAIWFIALAIHAMYILWFTSKFVANFNIKKVFVPWYVVYVGIAAFSVSSGAVAMTSIGRLLFWFALLSYVILLPIILYRVYKVKELPAPSLPTLTIFAAPASLLMVAYLSSFEIKSTAIIYPLLTLSLSFYLLGLFYAATNITKGFYPSAAAYTFPLVVSAIASKMTNGFFMKAEQPIAMLKPIVTVQTGIAALVVTIVFLQYIQFMLKPTK